MSTFALNRLPGFGARFRNLPGDLRVLAGLVLLGALLRFYMLGEQSYWYDEASAVRWTQLSARDLVASISTFETTPPFYFLAAWAWAKVFGIGEVGLRSLSALAGTATIPVVYLAGRELITRRAGLVAAALTATSPLLLWYSQEARSYSLFVLVSSVAFLYFARALRRGSIRELILWAAFCDLSLATHYFSIFFVVPEAAWLLYSLPRRRVSVAVASAQVAFFALALAPVAVLQGQGTSWIPEISKRTRVEQLPELLAVGFSNPTPWLVALVTLLIAVAVALAFALSDAQEQRGALVALGTAAFMLGIPLAGMVLGTDLVLTRNLIFAWLPLALLVAAGLGARRAGSLGLAAAGVLCALFAAMFVASTNDVTVQRPAWRAVADKLRTQAAGRVVLVSTGSAAQIGAPLFIYLPGSHALADVASADEIDVVGRADRSRFVRDSAPDFRRRLRECWWGAVCSIRSAPLPAHPPAPGFRLVARGSAGPFTVLRFRAPHPVSLAKNALLAFARANRLSSTLALQQDTAGR